jgi:alkylhydroperoxidase family enzyme
MAWIKTIPFEEADENLQKILTETRMSYPQEYAGPQPAAIPLDESIVDSHTLIPEALRHAFMTFSALMSPDLPLERRQHEMIATVVSATNDCFY